jgi:anti-anti-sigma regulatory factor
MMKLFHWKSQGIDFLVVSISEESARAMIKFEVGGWRWQNPARFDAVLKDLESPPYFVVDSGHVITIDSLARRA